MIPSRWPVRMRLTVLFAVSFLAAGAVLVSVTYFLVSRSLERGIPQFAVRLPSTVTPGAGDEEAARQVRGAIEAYRDDTLSSMLTWSLVALAGALVLAAGLGWLLAGRAMRPLQQVTETARRVADRSLHERIALSGPDDEVRELADTFDAMLERLDRSFDAQRRFVANASHELRTPLAVNRTVLEVAAGDAGASDDLRRLAPLLLATNERSERLVEGLLTLARSEQRLDEKTPIDLRDVAAVAVEQEMAGIGKVHASLHPGPVAGSPVLLERMVVNLVQNAVRHGGPDAAVWITTGRWQDHAVLQVENTGTVLRPYEVDGLFEPFRRGEGRTSSSNGLGLGLSIVRSVVRAHGGTVTAQPRDGGGLVVRVELPAQEDSQR
jgi:signal transduction histidine kinase